MGGNDCRRLRGNVAQITERTLCYLPPSDVTSVDTSIHTYDIETSRLVPEHVGRNTHTHISKSYRSWPLESFKSH